MSADVNIATDVAKQFVANMAAGDVNATLALIAPNTNVKIYPLNVEGGDDVMRDYLQQLATAFPELTIRTRRVFVGGDNTAVVEIAIRGVQAGEFFGILDQEKLLDLDQVWMLHITDGKIDNIAAYWDQNRLYRRLAVKRQDRVTITA